MGAARRGQRDGRACRADPLRTRVGRPRPRGAIRVGALRLRLRDATALRLRLDTGRELIAVAGCRGLTRSSLALNRATAADRGRPGRRPRHARRPPAGDRARLRGSPEPTVLPALAVPDWVVRARSPLPHFPGSRPVPRKWNDRQRGPIRPTSMHRPAKWGASRSILPPGRLINRQGARWPPDPRSRRLAWASGVTRPWTNCPVATLDPRHLRCGPLARIRRFCRWFRLRGTIVGRSSTERAAVDGARRSTTEHDGARRSTFPPITALGGDYRRPESASSRSMSRFASRAWISRRRSCCCLPLPSPSSTFALPRAVMYSLRGTRVRPLAFVLPRS